MSLVSWTRWRAGLIRASLTGDEFATDMILTRAVVADLDGPLVAFTTANPAGLGAGLRVRERGAGGGPDGHLMNSLVRMRAERAA